MDWASRRPCSPPGGGIWPVPGNCARVSRFEPLDAGDFNRVVTAINRNGVLNRRAALAAAASAVSVALRFAVDLIAIW